jgi:N-acyl amino acid synthase of PEP-CTERM/exosortase system
VTARQPVAHPPGDDPGAAETTHSVEVLSPYFAGLVIDDRPDLLEASYSLRYQVYCHERRFLRAADYPARVEMDAYDRQSVHLGVVNTLGELVATARLVQPSGTGLPLLHHCTFFPGETPLDDPARRVVEISRLSVSRKYNRRAGDGFYGLQGPTGATGERRGGGEIVMAIYKAIYQVSKRRGFTHWVIAAERALRRLVARYGFPFNAIGPETDYYGQVSPYLMDLREFDEEISSGRIPVLAEFVNGLEREHWPAVSDDWPFPGATHGPEPAVD